MTETSNVLMVDFNGLKNILAKYDTLYVIEEKISSKNKVKFRVESDGSIVMNIVRSSDNPVGFDFWLDEYALVSALKKIGVNTKFLDSMDDRNFICTVLNSVYSDKDEEFKALYEHDKESNRDKVLIFCDVDYQNYSISDILYSTFNGFSGVNSIEKDLTFINPTVNFDEGFSTYVIFNNDKVEIKTDDITEDKDNLYPGVFIKLPVIKKPKIEVDPAVFMSKNQCLWITKGFKFHKKGKEKDLPLDEWLSKNISLCLSKADVDVAVNVNQRLTEKKEGSGFLSDKYKDLIKHAIENCHVSKASRDGIIEECLNSPNVFYAALKVMLLVNSMDCKNSKKEKIARSAGHIIGHSSICSSCLSEKEDDDD